MPPLVSVITPMYNAGKFIAETMESVMAQTYENWEMLIVDNYSTDGCREIVLDYAQRDGRIRLVRLDFNSGGPARPRNMGMLHSRGDFFAFLDADDLWKKEKLERQVEFMVRRPEVGLLYTACLPMTGGALQKPWPEKPAMKAGHIFEELFLSNNFITCSSVLLRKNATIPRDFDEDRRMIAVEDLDLWLRIAQVAAIDFIPDPLVIYRLHDENLHYGLAQYRSRVLYMVGKWRPRACTRLIIAKYGRLAITFVELYLSLLLGKLRSLISDAKGGNIINGGSGR